eukprot:3974715-Prymnesium_polylepis.1
MDCYVTIKGSTVGQERTPCQNRTHNNQPRGRAIQRGDGLLRNGSIIWEAAHPDAPTLQRERPGVHNLSGFTTLQWGAGVSLSQVKCSPQTAGNVREPQVPKQGEKGQSDNPMGRWTVT